MNYITIVNDIIEEKTARVMKLKERIERALSEATDIEAQIGPLRQLAARLDAERQLELVER